MDTGDCKYASTALFEGVLRMLVGYIPAFLFLSLGAWLFLLIVFIAFFIYLVRLPDDEILRIKAQALENKRRLNIKIYRF
jgi:hypothetical protein